MAEVQNAHMPWPRRTQKKTGMGKRWKNAGAPGRVFRRGRSSPVGETWTFSVTAIGEETPPEPPPSQPHVYTMGGQEFQHYREHYLQGVGATELHTLDTWTSQPASPLNEHGNTWIVYIHGGAWRDPEVDSLSFKPALDTLLELPIKKSIAGFASINYRLSPYPEHPGNPSTPGDPSRNVHHPSHLEDVAHALLYLDGKYGIGDRYILAGHSAGATIAFGLPYSFISDRFLPRPACVVGIAGIYNFEAFVEAHKGIPVYREFMESAFPERSKWDQLSPSIGLPGYDALWQHTKMIVISSSFEDELVERAQDTYMLQRLGTQPSVGIPVHRLGVSGSHDGIWQNGQVLGGAIVQAMHWLHSLPS